MKRHRTLKLMAICALLTCGSALTAATSIGVCDFRRCLDDSKIGQQEQNALESIAKELAGKVEDLEKELQDLQQKMMDPDYVDSLSPEAESEVQTKANALVQQRQTYLNQYQMVMQQGQLRLIEGVRIHVMRAAQIVAREKTLDFVLDDNSLFFFQTSADVTDEVIKEMNQHFDQETQEQQKEKDSDQS